MIVVDCLRELDRRGMPYMGNVPVIRMSPERQDRIGTIVGCLLAEVFRFSLWRCQVERYRTSDSNTLFTARPPELLSLVSLPAAEDGAESMIVFPEPPLGADETQLFLEIAPTTRILTFAEWLEEIQ